MYITRYYNTFTVLDVKHLLPKRESNITRLDFIQNTFFSDVHYMKTSEQLLL